MKEAFANYNEVHVKYDHLSGCVFVVAMNTNDGQRANGGTRMKKYSSINEGIIDAIRLTQGTSKKCKIIGKEYNGGFSGGKGIIIGDPSSQKTQDMLMRYGEFVNSFEGQFITGTDLNIDNTDIQWMAKTSQYIDGLNTGTIGDTGIGTSYGIIYAMQKTIHLYEGRNSLSGLRICIQGLGSVGMRVVELLAKHDAQIIVTDLNTEKLNYACDVYGAMAVSPNEIYKIECDIFSPNAEGGVVNKNIVEQLRCRYILGAANNQMEIEKNDINNFWGETANSFSDNQRLSLLNKLLLSRNILYVPDYVVNVGGLYSSICEQTQKDFQYLTETLQIIVSRAIEYIYKTSFDQNISLLEAAEQLVS